MRIKLILISLLCFILSFSTVNANQMRKATEDMGYLGVLQASDYNSFGGITRYQAIKSITLAMGLTNELAKYADVINSPEVNYINIDRPIEEFKYHDFEVMDQDEYYVALSNDNLSKAELEKNYWHVKYTSAERGAVSVAFYNDITKGIMVDGKRYFMFEQTISLNEILAFMIRCLKGADADVSNAIETATALGIVQPENIFDMAGLKKPDVVGLGYFSILMKRFVNQKRYMYFDGNSENFPKASIDLEGAMTYKEYLMQNIAKDGMYSQTNPNIVFTSEMASKVADMVFKAEFGDYFVVNNPELTIDEFDGIYKITRKPKLPSSGTGSTIYINKYNGAVMDFIK